jgi:hypothetical protein
MLPGYRLVRNKSNRYQQDRGSMGTAFAGLGTNFLPHDCCAVEGAGPILDRTHEALGTTDRGIIVARKVLLQAIHEVQAGREAPALARDVDSRWAPNVWARSDVLLPSGADWHRYWENEPVKAVLATVAG